MAETLTLGLALGSQHIGIADLRAQLIDTSGANVGAAVSTGFVEIGNGFYQWTYASFPDAFQGGVKFYANSVPATFLAFIPINPVSGLTAQEVWDVLTANLLLSGSIGKRIVDNLDTNVASRMPTTSLPPNFSSLLISGPGKVTVGTNDDKAGYTTTVTPLDAAATRAAIGLATANLDTQFDTLPTATENATALLDTSNGIETGLTPRQALRLIAAANAGELSGATDNVSNTISIRNAQSDTKIRITAITDEFGNRSSVVTDLT